MDCRASRRARRRRRDDSPRAPRFATDVDARAAGRQRFVVGNIPSNFGLPSQENRLAGEFREFVARIVPPPTGDASKLAFEVVNSAVKTIEVGGTPARDLFDFCFFTLAPPTDN
jgi:hypothetical protein